MDHKIRKIATYHGQYNKILDVELPKLDIIRSDGLKTHIEKRHPSCVKYFDKVPEIIAYPDYIGINPKEKDSFELIKRYDDNVLIGIKLDVKNNYYYIATLHEIKQSKIDNRVFSGRLKCLNLNENT